MSIGAYLLVFGVAFGAGSLGLALKRSNPKALRLLLSFTGAYLFAITLVHLLPDLYALEGSRAGMYILAGFLLQILLENLSQGIEHGHIHQHTHGNGMRLALSVLIGLSVHAFLEGMPLGGFDLLHGDAMAHQGHGHGHEGHDHGHNHGAEEGGMSAARTNLLLGIVMHKAPAAFALVILLLNSGTTRWRVAAVLFLFAAMTPLGAYTAEWLEHSELISRGFFYGIMGIVVGSFLHISTSILFEIDEKHHHFSWWKLVSVLVGFGLAFLSMHNH